MHEKDHSQVQREVVNILRHYGFDATMEYWIERGRIDCAGWCIEKDVCGTHTIGLEVSKTSDLAKDIDRLLSTDFDLKFVVLLKSYNVPKVEGVYVVTLESFENVLRSILKISLEYPLYSRMTDIETIKDYAKNILESLGKNYEEIATTPQFKKIIEEFYEIYKDQHNIEELKKDLEDVLRKYYENVGEKGWVNIKEEKNKKVIFSEDLLPEGITYDTWERASKIIEEFQEFLEDAGFPHLTGEAVNLLLKVYSLGEVLIKEGTSPPYVFKPSWTYYVSPHLYNLLERGGYIKESQRKGTYQEGKGFFASLTPKGWDVAKSFAIKTLKENCKFIDDRIEFYGDLLSFMSSVASLHKFGYAKRSVEIIRDTPSDDIYKWVFISYEDCYDDYKIIYSLYKHFKIPLPVGIFLKFTTSLPLIRDKIIEFWQNFEDRNMVFTESLFVPLKRALKEGRKYRIYILPELADYILQKTRNNALERIEEEIIEDIGILNAIHMINILHRADWKDLSGNPLCLEDIINTVGISKEKLKDVVEEELYTRGLTGKLMDKKPYLIVLDESELMKYLIEKSKEIEKELIKLIE